MFDTKIEITQKQKDFAREYIIDFNGYQAAVRSGHNPSAAATAASRMLSHPNVMAYLKELMEQRAERVNLTQDMIVKELMDIAFCDVKDFYCDITGELLQPHELNDRAAKATASFKSTVLKVEDKNGKRKEETIDEYKRSDKIKALELLGKHLGVFEKDNRQKAPKQVVNNNFNDFYDDEEL